MRKFLTIVAFSFFIYGCNRHLLSANELDVNKEYRDIDEGLSNPMEVYKLFLHMPDSFSNKVLQFKRLNELDINNPKFSSLPSFIGRFKNLQTLIIVEGKISELPAEVGELKNLKWLRLWNLKLTTLPSQIGKLKKLETLELFANDLRTLPAGITKLTKLKKIGIDANDRLDFYDTFNKLSQLPDLAYLNLNYYPHDTLPGNIINLQNLETISLWNNKNGKLDLDDMLYKLSGLKRLKNIDLSGTPVDANLKDKYIDRIKKQHADCIVIWNSI